MADDDTVTKTINITATDNTQAGLDAVLARVKQTSDQIAVAMKKGMADSLSQTEEAVQRVSHTTDQQVGKNMVGSFNKANASMMSFVNGLTGAGVGLGLVAIAGKVGEIARQSLELAADTQESMIRIRQVTKESKDAIDDHQETIKKMAEITGESEASIADAMLKTVATTNLRGQALDDLSVRVARYAIVTKTSVPEALDLASQLMVSMKDPAHELSGVLDKLQSVTKGNADAFTRFFEMAAPRLQTIHDLTNEDILQLAVLDKGIQSTSSGDPRAERRKTLGTTELIEQASDPNSHFGMLMQPLIRAAVRAKGAPLGMGEIAELAAREVRREGMFDIDKSTGLPSDVAKDTQRYVGLSPMALEATKSIEQSRVAREAASKTIAAAGPESARQDFAPIEEDMKSRQRKFEADKASFLGRIGEGLGRWLPEKDEGKNWWLRWEKGLNEGPHAAQEHKEDEERRAQRRERERFGGGGGPYGGAPPVLTPRAQWYEERLKRRSEKEGGVPHMAEGGIVTEPTHILAGEAGPEAIIPLSGGGVGQAPAPDPNTRENTRATERNTSALDKLNNILTEQTRNAIRVASLGGLDGLGLGRGSGGSGGPGGSGPSSGGGGDGSGVVPGGGLAGPHGGAPGAPGEKEDETPVAPPHTNTVTLDQVRNAVNGPNAAPGDVPGGSGSTRTYNPPTIPAGMGGTVADQLKSGGIDLPPALEAKIRAGQQVTAEDLKALPPDQLEKINKTVTGMGQPPLYTDTAAKPGGTIDPHAANVTGDNHAKIAEVKAAMMAQARTEGVPEANVEEAANRLTGEALSESGSLNPNESHDSGSGRGIYGARGSRRVAMDAWMKSKGYASNSRAGEAAFMMHEAMTNKDYRLTRDILMKATAGNRTAGQVNAVTGNFEGPKVINSRIGNVNQAAGVPPAGGGTATDRSDIGSNKIGTTEIPATSPTVAASASATSHDAMLAPSGKPPEAFIVHHTGGRGDPASVAADWRAHRPGVGAQYIMDRAGVIHDTKKEYGYGGTAHIIQGSGAGKGLSSQNTVGMEIVARDDKDLTPAQIESGRQFIEKNYPTTPVYGHGEVNPGHREASEGATVTNLIRRDRAAAAAAGPAKAAVPKTAASPSSADIGQAIGGTAKDDKASFDQRFGATTAGDHSAAHAALEELRRHHDEVRAHMEKPVNLKAQVASHTLASHREFARTHSQNLANHQMADVRHHATFADIGLA